MTRPALFLLFLCLALSVAPRASAQRVASCSLEGFPNTIRHQLEKELVSWKVQQPDDLGHNARERWQAEKPLECPGIAVGKFEGDASAYAVLLVSRNRSTTGYKFLVFGPIGAAGTYGRRVVEESSDPGAENLFIRAIKVAKFFDEASKAKFHVGTSEAVLMVDAGESDYEADIYFWANGKYEQQPVDY